MSVIDDPEVTRRARTQIARRRGVLIGFFLVVLGVWGALIPFIGPYFHYAYSPNHAWRWTASRGWLEVLPGAVTAVGGVLVLISNKRATALLGAWMAAAGGAWFAIGISFVPLLHTGNTGAPASSHTAVRVLEAVGFFYGLGVVIVFFAATASGRLSVRSLADIHLAQRELDDELGAKIRTHHGDDTNQPVVEPVRTHRRWRERSADTLPTAATSRQFNPGEPLPHRPEGDLDADRAGATSLSDIDDAEGRP